MRRDRTLAGPPYLRTAGGAHLRVISLDLRPIHLQPLPYGSQKIFRNWVGEVQGPPADPFGPGGPVFRPYEGFCIRHGRPRGSPLRFYESIFETLAGGPWPRPYGEPGSVLSFRRGRTLAGPQIYAARPGGRALRLSTGYTCSAYSDADAEPQQRQFFQP